MTTMTTSTGHEQSQKQKAGVSLLYVLLIVVGTLIAFGSVLRDEFVLLDDPQNIYQNPRLNPPTWEGIAYYWKNPQYGLYIPVTYSAWGALAFIARVPPDPAGIALNPIIFHAVSILAHVVSAILVFAILIQLFEDRRAACIGALLFAIHPVQVESVAWAAGLKDVLAGMFALAAIWEYLKYAREPARKSAHYALGLGAFVLAMLSKPSALVIPLIAFLIDYWLIRRRGAKAILLFLVPWFALSLACAIVGRIVQPATGVPAAPIWARPLIMGDALTFYLGKLLAPLSLTIDYGRRPTAVMEQHWIYASWIVPALLSIILIVSRKRFPQLLAGWIVFVAGLLPVLGLVTFLFQFFSTTADHYLYLAMLGPAIALAGLLRYTTKPAVYLAAIVLLGALDLRTIDQTQNWLDDIKLFKHAVEANPKSFMARNNLGNAFLIRGEIDSAEHEFREAVRIEPGYPDSIINLAIVLEQKGQLSEAINLRHNALEIYESWPKEIQPDLTEDRRRLEQDLRKFSEKRSASPSAATTTSSP